MLDSIHPRNQPKRPRFRIWLSVLMLFLLGMGIFIGSRLVIFAQKIFDQSGSKFSIKQLFIAGDNSLSGEEEGQIRILLMGIGGEKHEGGTLTDTMILASLDITATKPRLSLVSIPRDLTVYIPGYEYRKINNAHAFGGPKLALLAVEGMTGKSIPYYAVIDFEGFKKVIDDLGGIKINVEHPFTDSMFPDEKFGYLEPISFEAGKQEMNGQRALQFVRSRHGTNNQGTDFARSRRQQQVLLAIKQEIMSFRVLTNLSLIEKILEDLGDQISTNLKPHEIKRFYDLGKDVSGENIFSLAIDNQSGLVCDQILEETGAYLLVPCLGLGNYKQIRDFIDNQFLLAAFQKEGPIIEIQNASKITGLSSRIQQVLNAPHLTITTGNFKGDAIYKQSIIYDNTKGGKPEALKYLQDKLGIRTAGSPFPFPVSGTNPDFVIVVAADLENKFP